jgi:DNA-binding CsgD family transcriptional regulator
MLGRGTQEGPWTREVGPRLGPLRGRADELSTLEALVASTREGAGGVVVVEGAAGIGKSRLLAEAGARAAAAGLMVAAGDADELDQVSAWRVLLDAVASTTPPVLPASETVPLEGLYDQRLAMAERVQAALEHASASRPVLVALDDMQWADAASLQAVGWLAQSLFSHPVGWVLALRPLPVRSDLDSLVRRLVAEGATKLHLLPLGAEASLALARDTGLAGSDDDLARQVAPAAGNPFYILALGKTDGSGAPGSVTAATREPRAAATETVAQHLRSLSDQTRRLLQVASVLGREFSVAEVASMMAQPVSQMLGAVEEALRAEVLTEVPVGLAFRHDLLRQAVYESVPASVRTALHREAAEALRKTGAAKARVAGQLAMGAAPGDAEATAAMLEAVTELGPSSPNAAADLALRMLELAGDQHDQRATMVLAAVDVLGRAGRLAEARAVSESYLATHRPPAPMEADLHFRMRQMWVFDRRDPYPDRVPERLLSNPYIRPELAATLTALDRVPMAMDWTGTLGDDGLDAAMRTVARGRGTPEFATVGVLRVQQSLSRGYMEDALARAQSAWADGRGMDGLGVLEEMVVNGLAANGRLREALSMMRGALESAQQVGRSSLVFRYRRLRAAILLSQGELDDAGAEARGVIDLPAQFGYPHRVALPLSVIVESALRRGDMIEARSAFARYGSGTENFFRDGAGARGFFPDLQWAEVLLAEARCDPVAATRALAPIASQLYAVSFIALTMHHRLVQLVRIALNCRAENEARQLAAMVRLLAERNPHVESLAAASHHARALIELQPASLDKAVQLAVRSEDRLLEAAAREDLAAMLATQVPKTESLKSRAVEHLEAAYSFYVRVNAHRDTARVRAALRALGVHKRQRSVARPRQGWASLSRSELGVVELVARGLSNRAVADELFVSPDTVNSHLRHAFMKLGIRSRVELARLAVQRDLTP